MKCMDASEGICCHKFCILPPRPKGEEAKISENIFAVYLKKYRQRRSGTMESEPDALETLIKLLKENKELLTNGQALAQAMMENATFQNHGVSVSFQKALLQTNIIESIAIADLSDDKSCDNASQEAMAELMPIMREDFAKKVVGILIGAIREVKREEKERAERERIEREEKERLERERKEEEQKRKAEEEKRKQEEEKRKEEERRKQEEEKRKAEEEKRKQEEQKRKKEEEQKRKEEERRKKKKSSLWEEILVYIISLAIPIGALAIYRDMYPSQPSSKETAKTANVTSNVPPKIDLNAVAKQPKQSSDTSSNSKISASQQHKEKAKNYYKSKEYDNAIKECTAWLAVSTNEADVIYDNRAHIYFAKKEFFNAIEDFTQAIKHTSPQKTTMFYYSIKNISALYSKRGWCYHCMGNYNKAIEDYTEAISIDQNNYFAVSKRCYAYRSIGDHEKAAVDYETQRTKRGTVKEPPYYGLIEMGIGEPFKD